MGNPMSQASKRTAVIAILLDVAVILGTLLSVVALSLGDLMEIIPLFAPLVASPFFPFFHEIHDLLAVAVVLYATYKYHVRLGVVAILLFLIAHIPYIIAEFTEGAPEILRVLLGVFIALLGIWLINQLQKSQEQTETHSQDARKERRFSQNIIATIPESLLVLDKNLRIKSANRSFYQLFQTNPENTIGRNLPSMLGEEAGTFSAELNRLFGTDDTLENFELHFQSERLGEKIFNITARGIIVAEEEEEEEEEELLVIRDVTERKRAEEALRRSEENFRRSLDDSPLGIRIVNEDGETIYANQAMLDIYGYDSIEELKMKPTQKRYTPESYAEHQVRKEKRQGSDYVPSNYEVSIVRKDGEIRHLEVFRKEVLWNGHTQFQVLYNDVTERKRAVEALKGSEELFRTSTEQMLDAFGIYSSVRDETGRIIDFRVEYVNPAACVANQMTKEEQVGKRLLELLPAHQATGLFDEYCRLVETGKPLAEESFVYEDMYGPQRLRRVFDIRAAKRGDGFVAVWRDITERKQAEQALEESEARYRSLVHLGAEVGEAIVMLQDEGEREGLQAFFNEAWPRIIGYSNKELPNMSFFDLVHFEDREASRLRHRRKMRGESIPGLFEVTIVRKDGTEVCVELTSARSTYQGKPTNVVYIRDLTERKQAEMERQANLSLFHSLIENMQVGVLVETDGRKIFVINKTFCHIFSISAPLEALLGSDCSKASEMVKHLLAEPDLFPRRIDEIVSKRKPVIAEEVRFADGHVFERDYIPIFADGDRFIGHMWQYRDITERKQAEVEKRELERKAHNTSRLASLGEMAAGIAHEINNPLTPVLGFTEILMKRELPEGIKSDLKIIYDSTKRTADVTRRLLTFARQNKPMRVLCQINEVVESTLQLRGYHLKTNNIKVISELDPELPQTTADAGQLQQVLLNLIMNAKYEMTQAHGGGNLLVKTERTGNSIRVSVKDDGPGILKENMERLFTPFFTTKKVGEGTGLGLSVCHGIVAEHNGRIYAESNEGKGATFIVELPIVKQQKEKETKPSESDTVVAREAVKAKILVVDDEPTIVQVLKRVLTDEGYQVKATGKAKEALRLVENGEFACILLDIKLPDMSGIELYQYLDKTDKSYTQKIIFITGDVMGPDTMDFFSRIQACYITKPFDIEQLKKEIKHKLTPRA